MDASYNPGLQDGTDPPGGSPMSIAPSVMIIFVLALMSLMASVALSQPWMRRTAVGCAIFEAFLAVVLIILKLVSG